MTSNLDSVNMLGPRQLTVPGQDTVELMLRSLTQSMIIIDHNGELTFAQNENVMFKSQDTPFCASRGPRIELSRLFGASRIHCIGRATTEENWNLSAFNRGSPGWNTRSGIQRSLCRCCCAVGGLKPAHEVHVGARLQPNLRGRERVFGWDNVQIVSSSVVVMEQPQDDEYEIRGIALPEKAAIIFLNSQCG